jgi:hypothetical protein
MQQRKKENMFIKRMKEKKRLVFYLSARMGEVIKKNF